MYIVSSCMLTSTWSVTVARIDLFESVAITSSFEGNIHFTINSMQMEFVFRYVVHYYSARNMLQPNNVFTLRPVLAVFTRSAITPPKVNRFGWNLEHSEYIIGGWLSYILVVIRIVTTAGEPGEIFCQVSNARFQPFPIGQILRNLNTTRRSVSQ